MVSLTPQAQGRRHYSVAEPRGQEYSIYLDQQWDAEDHFAVVAGIRQDLHHTHIEIGLDDHTVAVLAGT